MTIQISYNVQTHMWTLLIPHGLGITTSSELDALDIVSSVLAVTRDMALVGPTVPQPETINV